MGRLIEQEAMLLGALPHSSLQKVIDFNFVWGYSLPFPVQEQTPFLEV